MVGVRHHRWRIMGVYPFEMAKLVRRSPSVVKIGLNQLGHADARAACVSRSTRGPCYRREQGRTEVSLAAQHRKLVA